MRRITRAAAAVTGLGLFVLLIAMPAAEAAVFNPDSFTLKNGLRVVVIENHRVPIVTHMVWYKVGAADERRGKSGIAHFLEHLMFKGTKTLKPGEFSRIVARNGGRGNAFTSSDYTAYFQSVAADRLETVMRLEADRMANLVLTEKVVRPELKVVIEERRMRTDNRPAALLREEATATLYANSPYGIPVIGWEREMRQMTAKRALAFYHRYYAPNNAILVVAGDITAARLKPLAEKYYGVIPARPIPPRLRPQEPAHHAPRRVVLRDERVGQPAWARRYLAPSYMSAGKENAFPLQVLSEILGGGTTSRLYRRLVVEQKLAVNAGAWYQPNSVDRTAFGLFATPRPGVDTARLETAMQAEIDKVLAEGVTAAEVETAKTRLSTAAIYARDSVGTGAHIFGAALAIGRTVAEVEAWPDHIAAVTADQVKAAAAVVFQARNSVTSVLLPKRRVGTPARTTRPSPVGARSRAPDKVPAKTGAGAR